MSRVCSSHGCNRTLYANNTTGICYKCSSSDRYVRRVIDFADRGPADPLDFAFDGDVSPADILHVAEGIRHE
jgi:hypothetical protein